MKTAAVFFADGFEEVEALTPVDYLRRAGVEVTVVAVPSPTMKDEYVVTGGHKVSIIADKTLNDYLKDCEKQLPDCVLCPGGSVGAENLAATPKLLAHLEECNKAGKITAAICASPAVVLGKTNVLKGKKWTCYPDMETYALPEYQGNYSNKTFVSDNNVVTARGAGASEEFAMELITLLVNKETSEKIRKGTQQR